MQDNKIECHMPVFKNNKIIGYGCIICEAPSKEKDMPYKPINIYRTMNEIIEHLRSYHLSSKI